MPRDNRQRVKAIVLSVLVFLVVGVIVWEIVYFTRPRGSHSHSMRVDASATSRPPAPAPGEDKGATVASGVPTADLSAPQPAVTVTTRYVSDPFKPAREPQKKSSSSPRVRSVIRQPRSPLLNTSGSLPPLVPFMGMPLDENASRPSQRAPQEDKGMRVTGIIMDASSAVAIIEGKDEQHLLYTGDSLPNGVRVTAISPRSVIVSRGQQRYQVSVGEKLPWEDGMTSSLQRPSAPAAPQGGNVGPPAPRFSLLAPDGKTRVSLADYKGKTVLLNFFASW